MLQVPAALGLTWPLFVFSPAAITGPHDRHPDHPRAEVHHVRCKQAAAVEPSSSLRCAPAKSTTVSTFTSALWRFHHFFATQSAPFIHFRPRGAALPEDPFGCPVVSALPAHNRVFYLISNPSKSCFGSGTKMFEGTRSNLAWSGQAVATMHNATIHMRHDQF